jgi:hypothetical protein
MLTTRNALSAAIAAAFLVLPACGEKQVGRNEAAVSANAAETPVVPEIPLPKPPMGREQLLGAVTRAASDFATGVDDRSSQKALADKKFEFRIRFGCGQPADVTTSPLGWSFDQATGALKARATPTLTIADAAVKSIAGDAFESVEGFWLQRPWVLRAACPAEEAPPAADLHSVGIAQFFSATGPRTMRRSGRAYETTQKIDDGATPTDGFDLVLTGRLVPLPDGRVIACTRSTGPGRPACIVSVEFGTVSIERADTHEQLAQWGSG